jgi:nicotinamide-nucleotide amidase
MKPAMNTEIEALAAAVLEVFRAQKLLATTAESCTGGLLAGAITDIPGSSDIFDRGFVTYSNKAKQEMLGVAARTLLQYGAVSAQTAIEMAEGALKNSRAHIAASITGVAGPGGGSAQKPVGLVHFACARRGGETRHVERRFGPLSRSEIRTASVKEALTLLLDAARI